MARHHKGTPVATSLLNTILSNLAAEEREYSLLTGRGKGKANEQHLERVGHSKGLLRAIEIVKTAAKAANAEDDEHG